MAITRITYDHSLMWASAAAAGMPEEGRATLGRTLDPVKQALMQDWKSGRIGFFSIPDLVEDHAAVRSAARDIAKKFTDLIVVGIGGSDLGTRAILRALAPAMHAGRPAKPTRGKGMAVHFIGANTDPEEIASLLGHVDLRRTAINIISKSGDTIEPMATFLLLRDKLIKAVGRAKHASHVIATTDAKEGTLRHIAEREGYRTLPVPGNIGGRFSSLTTVGLFPVACAGVNVTKLLAGCKDEFDVFAARPAAESAPLLFAGLHGDGYHRGKRITVLMPYAEGLRDFGFWFRQLWAESLGKKLTRDGKIAHIGFTPVAALGATDQHSQIQLYSEGPLDKIVTFVEVKKFRADFRVPNPYPDTTVTAAMAGHRFSDIIHAERASTAQALADSGRPNGTLNIPGISPETVGGLMTFFMLATAATAELLNVNAYDQPGVEGGKQGLAKILAFRGNDEKMGHR